VPTCPLCAESIEADLIKCPHCGEGLVAMAASGGGSPVRAGGSTYDVLQDKVGLVPNVRLKDNLIQAVVTVVAVALGVGIGAVVSGAEGALVGALGGLVLGGLGSGFVLMIVGLFRR
jgi:hypothetical protein